MPLHEYQCPRCGRFEIIQKFSDAALKACPTCGREVTKLLSASSFQFKGSGWYVTDYARKGSGGDGASKEGASKEGAPKEATAAKDAAAAKEASSGSSEKSASKDTSNSGSSSRK